MLDDDPTHFSGCTKKILHGDIGYRASSYITSLSDVSAVIMLGKWTRHTEYVDTQPFFLPGSTQVNSIRALRHLSNDRDRCPRVSAVVLSQLAQ